MTVPNPLVAQAPMRPDSMTGPPVSGLVDSVNGAAQQVIIIAHDMTYDIHTPLKALDIVGQNLDFAEGQPTLHFNIIGEFQSGVLSGAKYYGQGGGPLKIILENNQTTAGTTTPMHYFTGTAHLDRDVGRFIRWAIWGRSIKTMRFLPSYGHRTISGYLTNWTEYFNGGS